MYNVIDSLSKKLLINSCYIEAALSNNKYIIHTIPKRKRGIRIIAEPSEELQVFHSFFLSRLKQFSCSESAYAYIKNKSIISHAQCHLSAKEIISFDVKDFFGSISEKKIEMLLRSLFNLDNSESKLLAQLVCYNNCLPQGTKVSPLLTNLYLYEFDEIIKSWAEGNQIVYTRYSDDLYFSKVTEMNFDLVKSKLEEELKKINLNINPYKTIHMDEKYLQVTNIRIINGQLKISRKYKKKIESELYFINKFGLGIHMYKMGLTDSEKNLYLENLLGRIKYVVQVEPIIGEVYLGKFFEHFENNNTIHGTSFRVKERCDR